MGVGAKVWGNPNALWYGLLFGALIIPVFVYRHYVQDKGRFPDHMLVDLDLRSQDLGARRAGFLPYLTLIVGAAITLFGHYYFQLPPPA
jgi:hypothetical protein